jgi:hypothetical protein
LYFGDEFCLKNKIMGFLDVQREEKNVQKAIREAAKRNDMGSAKVLPIFLFLFLFSFFLIWLNYSCIVSFYWLTFSMLWFRTVCLRSFTEGGICYIIHGFICLISFQTLAILWLIGSFLSSYSSSIHLL